MANYSEDDRLICQESLKKELEKSVEQLISVIEMKEKQNKLMKLKNEELRRENLMELGLINAMKEKIDDENAKRIDDLELVKKMTVIDKYIEEKSEAMFYFINKHYPLPGEREVKIAKQISSNISNYHEKKFLSMMDTIELLINKWQVNRSDAWINVENENLWPTYVNLLFTFNIIQRHPKKPHLIAIVTKEG